MIIFKGIWSRSSPDKFPGRRLISVNLILLCYPHRSNNGPPPSPPPGRSNAYSHSNLYDFMFCRILTLDFRWRYSSTLWKIIWGRGSFLSLHTQSDDFFSRSKMFRTPIWDVFECFVSNAQTFLHRNNSSDNFSWASWFLSNLRFESQKILSRFLNFHSIISRKSGCDISF